jgi:hypothetical protein
MKYRCESGFGRGQRVAQASSPCLIIPLFSEVVTQNHLISPTNNIDRCQTWFSKKKGSRQPLLGWRLPFPPYLPEDTIFLMLEFLTKESSSGV